MHICSQSRCATRLRHTRMPRLWAFLQETATAVLRVL